MDPDNSNYIYACHRGLDGIYRSTNGGTSFSKVYDLSLASFMQLHEKSGYIFVQRWLGSTGLYASYNSGDTWQLIRTGSVDGFTVRPDSENVIFINTGYVDHAYGSPLKAKLYKTTNGGNNWSLLRGAGGDYDGYALYADPINSNVMLMATRDGGNGIMRSLDGGNTWHSIHNNHPQYRTRGFVYGGVPGRVYTWDMTLARVDDIYAPDLSVEGEADANNSSIRLCLTGYPNPFSCGVNISYRIPCLADKSIPIVKVSIYDILGNKIRSVFNGVQSPGYYNVYWDGLNNQGMECPNSVYFCNVTAGNHSIAHRLLHRR